MTDLSALAERIEAAEGPSRDLDAEIATALGLPWDYAADWGPRGHDKPVAFAYTSSLDAAMTLVPEGWAWMCGCAADEGFFATLSPTDESGIDADIIDTNAATPALALAVAAIRARSQGGTDNG